VTVLFTDLSDSTYLSGAMEAETYATMLDEVRSAFRTAVEARGGVANQYQGDGLQAIFGHAEPTENDGRRALEAALEVHAVVRSLRKRYGSEGAGALSVHSGLHAGQALLRPGDSVAGRIELFGPAPGIAKHLSDDAEADEILVSEETLGPAARLFITGAARAVLLKGRSEPLVVCSILSRVEPRTRVEAHSQRGLIAFVGREVELARLEAVLDDVLPGRLRLAVICAQPGLGKTRLAEEFLHRAARRGFAVLRGGCDTELSAEPLQPFLQMLRTQLRIAPDACAAEMVQAIEAGLEALDPALAAFQAELLQALSVAPQAGTPQRLPAERTMCALLEVISALARRGPLALFVDDWQWADDAT
jgi:class 3 adenylate cyclase